MKFDDFKKHFRFSEQDKIFDNAKFWIDKLKDLDQTILSQEEIKALNKDIVEQHKKSPELNFYKLYDKQSLNKKELEFIYLDPNVFSNNKEMVKDAAKIYDALPTSLSVTHAIAKEDSLVHFLPFEKYFNIPHSIIYKGDEILVLDVDEYAFVCTSICFGWIDKQSYEVTKFSQSSVKFKELTQKGILNEAFEHLDEPYKLAELGGTDCVSSLYNIFKIFGIYIPKTTYLIQQNMRANKPSNFEDIPVGSILLLPGHAMLYIGEVDNKHYVFNNIIGLYQEDGSKVDIKKACVICLEDSYLKNGTNYLNAINYVVDWKNYGLSKTSI